MLLFFSFFSFPFLFWNDLFWVILSIFILPSFFFVFFLILFAQRLLQKNVSVCSNLTKFFHVFCQINCLSSLNKKTDCNWPLASHKSYISSTWHQSLSFPAHNWATVIFSLHGPWAGASHTTHTYSTVLAGSWSPHHQTYLD